MDNAPSSAPGVLSPDALLIEYVEETAVLRLPVPGFDQLTLDEKMIAYHLWHAGVAGDSIMWDQSYRYGLLLRDVFLGLLDFRKDFPAPLAAKLENYTKRLLINHGNHDFWSTKKFLPGFTYEEFKMMYDHAREKRFPVTMNDQIREILFDPAFEEYLTQKNPGPGQDILTASHNNFYVGVTMAELGGFDDANPNNSTLTKERGAIVEKIWRAGSADQKIPPGLYAAPLRKVCEHLRHAATYASPDDQKHLILLARYFEEGTAQLWDDFNIRWLHANPQVDSILGFVEEYRDTRGRKGLFESMVYLRDRATTELITKVATISQSLENSAPWHAKYKKTWTKIPVANAITQLIGTGGAGPICWAGVNLPNAQWIREKYGSKNVVIANVTQASRQAFAKQSTAEFIETPQDQEMMLATSQVRGPLMVTLHEVVGHGSGKSNPELKGDPREHLQEYYSALEEARAELCALHHIWNPLLISKGIIPDEKIAKAAYLGYVLSDLTQLRMLEHETEIHEDHLRATHLIIQWLMREKKCCAFAKGASGKTYPRVLDYAAMREGVAELLAEIQRIKSEGDYSAIKALIDTYGREFDPTLRDEIVARSKAIKYPAFYAYVMPEPVLVKDPAGNVTDVVLEYPAGIVEQARRWKELGR